MTPEELSEAKARANKKRALRRLWASDSTNDEICEDLDLSGEEFAALVVEMKLPERKEPTCYLPTPQEIRIETAKIRMGWSQEERESRLERARSVRIEIATGGDYE
jgi:hypothetical protein